MISSHLDLTREGNILQVYHKFAYLKKNHNMDMVYGPSDPSIDKAAFNRKEWTSIEVRHI